MALVVENGTGLPNADSYVAVADVSAYLASFKTSAEQTAWSSATTDSKERACRLAAVYLDGTYGGVLPGVRLKQGQTRLWPREEAYDLEGYKLEDYTVPASWLDANKEIALRFVQGDNPLADVTESAVVASETSSVGPISTSVTYLGGKSSVKKYAVVNKLLAPLIGYVGTVYTG